MTAGPTRTVRRPAGLAPEAVLAGLAVLLRRYTGSPKVDLALPGGVLLVDLTGDPDIAAVRAAVAAGLPPGPAGADRPADPAGAAGVVPGAARGGGGAAAGPGVGSVRAVVEPYGELVVTIAADAVTLGSVEVPAGVLDWLAADLPVALAASGRVSAALPDPAAERRPAAEPVDDARFPAAVLESSIPARFAAVAAARPDAPAVLADDGTLTYAELAAAAAAVTAAVRALPAPGPGDAGRVGLLLDPGTAIVAAILGVLGAGRAYVPLDPGYPVDRLAAAVADADLSAVLATAGHRPLAERLLARPVPVLDPTDLPPAPPAAPLAVGPDDPAYVLYTSGSTGRPKGVVQLHRGVLFQARNHALAHGVTAADRVGVVTSFGFDAAVTDLFTALLTGAAAVPVDVRRHGLGHLLTALRDRRVSVYHSPPTLFRYLVGALGPDEVLDDVRVVLLGGEQLTRGDVESHRRHFRPGSLLVNGYGATEVSFALQDRRTADTPLDGEIVPIGRPLDGLGVLLLAPDGQPAGLAGEIVVRGRAVAAGYRDRPAEEAERFTDLGGGVRQYRTGDLGRRLPDGRIAYAGRRDRQVKIRGYRVELGEVESVLRSLPGVAQAAVAARPERAGGTLEVIGYVTGTGLDPAGLRRAVADRLPHFSVPRTVLVLDALPLTPTGKVDTLALPDPPPPAAASTPDGPVERLVAAAWCGVLGVDSVGPDANFFEAGGHSLLLARLQQLLQRDLGRAVPLHRLLEHPTVRSFSAWAAADTGAGAGAGAGGDALAEARARMARRRDRRPTAGTAR